MLDLRKALALTGMSARKLGAQVLVGWRRLEKGRAKFPQSDAIGVKVGLLRNGEPKWWSNPKQRKALQALAEILRCAPEEIVAPDDTNVGAISIRAFPELAPILPGQDPCQVHDEGSWLGSEVANLLRDRSRSWVIARPGSGKSLALEVLRQRLGTRVAALRCRRLVDAVKLATRMVPILIEVSDVDQATDEGALAELSKAPVNVCVLAPFSLALIPKSEVPWHQVSWAPNSDWRERLLKWANARAPRPADLDVEDLLQTLRVLDPDERLFVTPEDVLTIAARAYRSRLPPARGALRDLAREHLGRLFSGSDLPWVRDFGLTAVESLVQRRFTSTDHPVGPLHLDAWARLLPKDVGPSPALAAVSSGSTRAKSPDAAPPMQALLLLVQSGVLRTQSDGHFDFAPWICAGIERDLLSTCIKKGDLGWALLGVEPSRRVVIDGTLDLTPPSALLPLLRRVLNAEPSKLETVAAIESLFCAFARRLSTGWTAPPDSIPHLQQLGVRQLDLIRRQPEGRGFPGSPPLTRQTEPPRHDVSPTFRPATRRWRTATRLHHPAATWIGEAWTFSFGVDAPELDVDPGWILPGWSSNLRLENAPHDLPHIEEDERLRVASREALRKCRGSELPAKISPGLIEWVIIDGPARGWTITRDVQARLVGPSGVGDVVGHLLLAESPEIQRQGARTAWSAVLAMSALNPFHALDLAAQVSPVLHAAVVDNVPVEDFAAAFRGTFQVTMDEGRVLRGLPPRLIRPALLALVERLERDHQPAKDLEPLLEALGEEDLDLLLRFGSHGFTHGYAAARRVWALAPEMAVERLRSALTDGDRLARVWFDTGPDDRLDDLVAELRRLGGRAPAWSATWLAGVLPRAGRAAPAAYDLLRTMHHGHDVRSGVPLVDPNVADT